jgi:hypothetical protein
VATNPSNYSQKPAEDKPNRNPTDFKADHCQWHGFEEHIGLFLLNRKISQTDKSWLSEVVVLTKGPD